MVDWRSHRLKRACHCTLYAESMASRASATSAKCLRHFFLEVAIKSHRASHSVETPICGEVTDISQMLPIHVVTDCNSLHEIVIESCLPEDRRAAIEFLAIREMVTAEDFDSDSEVEAESGCSRNTT